MLHRCSKGTLDAPSVSESPQQGGVVNAEQFGPLNSTARVIIPLNYVIVAFISILRIASSPRAIGRAVAKFIINTLKSVFRGWTMSHVTKKRHKGLPFFTDRDSSTAIVVVGGTMRSTASHKHSMPYIIFRCVIEAMRSVRRQMEFAFEAPAAFRLAGPKVSRTHVSSRTTLTLAGPHALAVNIVSGECGNSPSSEHLSGQVFDSARDNDRIFVSHKGTSNAGVTRTARRLQPSGCSHLYSESTSA